MPLRRPDHLKPRVSPFMSDCLHCDINELVKERLARGNEDLGELAAMMAESLAELILLAPEVEQSKLMADCLAHLGHAFLEKSELDPDDAGARH
jgi:hypothetical protein